MNKKEIIIFMLLLTGVAISTGIGQDIFAQTPNSDGSTLKTQGEIKSGAPSQKKFGLSKRNLMMIEQAESARMRAEKIMASPQDKAEMPKK